MDCVACEGDDVRLSFILRNTAVEWRRTVVARHGILLPSTI